MNRGIARALRKPVLVGGTLVAAICFATWGGDQSYLAGWLTFVSIMFLIFGE